MLRIKNFIIDRFHMIKDKITQIVKKEDVDEEFIAFQDITDFFVLKQNELYGEEMDDIVENNKCVIDINKLVYKFIMSKVSYKTYLNEFRKVDKHTINPEIDRMCKVINSYITSFITTDSFILYPDNMKWNYKMVEKYIYQWRNSSHRCIGSIYNPELSSEMLYVDYIKYRFTKAFIDSGVNSVLYNKDDKLYISENVNTQYDGVTNNILYYTDDSVETGAIIMGCDESDYFLIETSAVTRKPMDERDKISQSEIYVDNDFIENVMKYRYSIVNDLNIDKILNEDFILGYIVFTNKDHSESIMQLYTGEYSPDVALSILEYIAKKYKFLNNCISYNIHIENADMTGTIQRG